MCLYGCCGGAGVQLLWGLMAEGHSERFALFPQKKSNQSLKPRAHLFDSSARLLVVFLSFVCIRGGRAASEEINKDFDGINKN